MPLPPSRPHRVCVAHLGTNVFRALFVQIDPDGRWTVLSGHDEVVHLAADGLASRFLTHEALQQGFGALDRIRALGNSHQVESWLAFATGAIRDAANGPAFIDEAERRTGFHVRPISHGFEAALLHRGMLQGGPVDTPSLWIHIGGGSVAVVVATPAGTVVAQGFPLGAAHLTDRFVTTLPIDPAEIEALEAHFEGVLAGIVDVGKRHGVRTLVASESLAGHAEHAQTASVLLGWVCSQLPIDTRTTSSLGLREGMVAWFVEHQFAWVAPERIADPRRREVLVRAQLSRVRVGHSQHTVSLALRLFDALQPILPCKRKDRELLEYGAMLHDIGRIVGRKRRHHHAAAMVENTEWKAFSPREVRFLTGLVRYHRGALPGSVHPSLAAFEPNQLRRVECLAAVLRLAVALDRAGFQNVVDFELTISASRVGLRLYTLLDPTRELRAARRAAAAVQRAVGRTLVVEASSPTG